MSILYVATFDKFLSAQCHNEVAARLYIRCCVGLRATRVGECPSGLSFHPDFPMQWRIWKFGKGGSVVNVVNRGAKRRKKFFAVIFQLPGWAVVAPSCFALHCHCSLVSVQSVTVCMTLAMRSCSRRGLIPFQLSVTKKCLNVYLAS